MARKKGEGQIIQRGKAYYLRLRNKNGQKVIRLDATDIATAEIAAEPYRKIIRSEDIEEVAFFARQAMKASIGHKSKSPLISAFKFFEESPARPLCGTRQLASHKRYWTEFVEYVKTYVYLDNLTVEVAESYFSKLDKNPPGFNKRLASCKLIYRIVMRGKPNIFDEIRKKTEIPRSKRDFTPEQIRAIFKAADVDYKLTLSDRAEISALLRILAYTGMRLKDACLLKNSDVGKDTIMVIPYKTMHHVIKVELPIHPELSPFLERKEDNEYILPNLAARYIRGYGDVDIAVNRIIDWALEREHKQYTGAGGSKSYCRPARIKEYGVHSFRHSFISFMANAGIPMEIVKSIVGHRSAAVTRIYTHITAASRTEAIASLPKI